MCSGGSPRGYRVKTQHRVGRFHIDLVIEGRRGRLAVELNGDAYHGPDRWEADRQRPSTSYKRMTNFIYA
jgi:very-short-patch-repair endonuclease